MIWQCRKKSFDLSQRVLVMGILNVTPDSFSDGGKYVDPDLALARALEMENEGADIIDLGGESSRPKSKPVPEETEMNRVVPVVQRIRAKSDVAISVDTRKASVARAALAAGADIVNDISALRHDPQMAEVAAQANAGVVLMHMQGTPETMQDQPDYKDIVADISEFLRDRIEFAMSCGIAADSIALDPGIGFGKTAEHNLTILREMNRFNDLGRPVLSGPSRKSFLRYVLFGDNYPDNWPTSPQIAHGTAAALTASILNGARIVRVHDVAEARSIIRTGWSLR